MIFVVELNRYGYGSQLTLLRSTLTSSRIVSPRWVDPMAVGVSAVVTAPEEIPEAESVALTRVETSDEVVPFFAATRHPSRAALVSSCDTMQTRETCSMPRIRGTMKSDVTAAISTVAVPRRPLGCPARLLTTRKRPS